MKKSREEFENPAQWLRQLEEERGAYRRLISDSGGLACAAYRVARARCRVDQPEGAPSLRELQQAALLLAERLGENPGLPITSVLLSAEEVPERRRQVPPPWSRRPRLPSRRPFGP